MHTNRIDDPLGPDVGGEPHGCRQRHVVVGVGRRCAGVTRHHPHLPRPADHRRHRQPQRPQDAGTGDVTSSHPPTPVT